MTHPSPGDNSIHDAIDALFDGEMTDADARQLLSRAEPAACESIAKTQRIVSMIKAPVEAPDLTSSILQQVEDDREFVTSPWRRAVRVGRLAVAACLLLGLLSIAVAQRVWPEATSLTVQPRPVSALLLTTEQEAVDRVRALNHSIEQADQQVTVVRAALEDSRPAPEKFSSSDRHVFAVSSDAPVTMTVEVEIPSGAGLPRSVSEAVVWHSAAPHVSDQCDAASTFRSGMTWSFDLGEVVQLQLLKREAEPTELRSAVFRKLP